MRIFRVYSLPTDRRKRWVQTVLAGSAAEAARTARELATEPVEGPLLVCVPSGVCWRAEA